MIGITETRYGTAPVPSAFSEPIMLLEGTTASTLRKVVLQIRRDKAAGKNTARLQRIANALAVKMKENSLGIDLDTKTIYKTALDIAINIALDKINNYLKENSCWIAGNLQTILAVITVLEAIPLGNYSDLEERRATVANGLRDRVKQAAKPCQVKMVVRYISPEEKEAAVRSETIVEDKFPIVPVVAAGGAALLLLLL